jgi:hypothetical protein
MSPMSGEIRVKGSAFVGVLRAIEATKGKSFYDAALESLQGEGGEALRTKSVLAAGWYPCAWYRDLLGAAERAAGEGPAFVREIGRISTRESVSSVHRIFMRVMSPDTLIKQGARVFSSFYEASLKVVPIARGNVQIVWAECHGFDGNCWLDQLGAMDALVAMSGAKLPRLRLLSGGQADNPGMTVECLWRAG